MERRHNRFQRRDLCLLVNVHGNPAAVVNDTHTVLRKKRNLNIARKPAHRLIARVVKNLGDEVVKPIRPGRTYVHPRALTHRLQTLKNGNRRGIVVMPAPILRSRLLYPLFLLISSRSSRHKKRKAPLLLDASILAK